MKRVFLLFMGLVIAYGCARVRVEAPKEPIKVDVSMRLDIYQHVQKDIDAIEDIVSGKDKGSFLNYLLPYAYAQEGLAAEVEEAALRRRDRRQELFFWQAKGVVGENRLGLTEIRDSSSASEEAKQLVRAENSDRMIIYQSVAKKNNATVEETQKLYAKRLQEDAPEGTPIEALNEASSSYEWKVK